MKQKWTMHELFFRNKLVLFEATQVNNLFASIKGLFLLIVVLDVICVGIASNLNHLAYPLNIDSIPIPPLPLSTLQPFNHKLFLYMQNLLSNQCSTKILGSKSVLCAARGLS